MYYLNLTQNITLVLKTLESYSIMEMTFSTIYCFSQAKSVSFYPGRNWSHRSFIKQSWNVTQMLSCQLPQCSLAVLRYASLSKIYKGKGEEILLPHLPTPQLFRTFKGLATALCLFPQKHGHSEDIWKV